jgi:hypothetical protein
MQSGERERAGSSDVSIENKQEIRRLRRKKTMRGSGACRWIAAGAMVYERRKGCGRVVRGRVAKRRRRRLVHAPEHETFA